MRKCLIKASAEFYFIFANVQLANDPVFFKHVQWIGNDIDDFNF